MEFSAFELYVVLPVRLAVGCSVFAVRKLLEPVDKLYQLYVRRNNTSRRRRLSDLSETSRQLTELNIPGWLASKQAVLADLIHACLLRSTN